MNHKIPPLHSWPRSLLEIGSSLLRSCLWTGISSQVSCTPDLRVPHIGTPDNADPNGGTHNTISLDFFGVNIASAPDPAVDDYVIQSLSDLGIKHVRMGFSYDSIGSHGERMLKRALTEGYCVMLNIFPPKAQAALLADSIDAQSQWRDFVETVFSTYQQQVTTFEVGNTTNRKKWSGFTLPTILQAWNIAYPIAEKYNLTIAGPNISDFEPFYNIAYLHEMKQRNQLPSIHTDNIFVERVMQPEVYDHRVLGSWAKSLLKLNLIKKSRIIADIGKHYGCLKTFCTYNCWTLKRLDRRNINPEQKQADYLVRYLILAIASSALQRTYWGPLVCHRDGLIDCGADNKSYPQIDNVAYYKQIRGTLESFTRRPAFFALQQLVSCLSDACLVQGVSANNGINHFVFLTSEQKELHVCWCIDNYALPLSSIYPQTVSEAIFQRAGQDVLSSAPHCITEHPLFISFSSDSTAHRPEVQDINNLTDLRKINVIAGSAPHKSFFPFTNEHWQGAMLLNSNQTLADASEQLLPEALEQAEVLAILRDKRNKIWNVRINNKTLSIKLNRTVGFKRLTYRFQHSKAKRHWNNANTMLRRGVKTPQPIAFFERKNNSGIESSYYVTEFIENAFSSREVFSSVLAGEQQCKGIDNSRLLKSISEFICHMHDQGILHRDLSAGNLLLTIENDKINLFLIDIGRAKVLTKLTKRQRLIDVMRINYKLPWSGREAFMSYYQNYCSQSLSGWRWAVRYYECKQRSKKAIKGKFKKKSKT